MIWNWFKKIVKDHPKFWETYLSYFNENKSNYTTAQLPVLFLFSNENIRFSIAARVLTQTCMYTCTACIIYKTLYCVEY